MQAVFRAVLYADLDFEGSPWDTLSPDAKHLVQALLNRDASQRPTALEALHFKCDPAQCCCVAKIMSKAACIHRHLLSRGNQLLLCGF